MDKNKDSIYVESLIIGAEAVAKRTGKPVSEILEESLKESEQNHDQALSESGTSSLSTENIEESRANWRGAHSKANKLVRNKEKKEK